MPTMHCTNFFSKIPGVVFRIFDPCASDGLVEMVWPAWVRLVVRNTQGCLHKSVLTWKPLVSHYHQVSVFADEYVLSVVCFQSSLLVNGIQDTGLTSVQALKIPFPNMEIGCQKPERFSNLLAPIVLCAIVACLYHEILHFWNGKVCRFASWEQTIFRHMTRSVSVYVSRGFSLSTIW